MKRIGLIVVSLVVISSMLGCGNTVSRDGVSDTTNTTKEVSTTVVDSTSKDVVNNDKEKDTVVLSEELLRNFDSRNTYVHDDVNVDLFEYDDSGNIVNITPLIWYREGVDFKNKRIFSEILDPKEYNTLSEHSYDANRDYYSQRYYEPGQQGSDLFHENENIFFPKDIYDYLIKLIPVLKSGFGEENMDDDEHDSLISYWFTFYSDTVPSDISCIESYDSLGETYVDVDMCLEKDRDIDDSMEVDIDTEFYSNDVRYVLSTEHLLLFSNDELEDNSWYGKQK